MTILIKKIIIRYGLLQFKAAIKPPWFLKKPFHKEGTLRIEKAVLPAPTFSFRSLLMLVHETPVALVVRLEVLESVYTC